MKIGGPFLDKARRKATKKWYLSYFVPKTDAAGTVILREGKPILERKRPYYESKDAAQADKPRILAQYATGGAGTGEGVLTREQVAEFEEMKRLAPEVTGPDLARFWRIHHPLQATQTISEHVTRILQRIEDRRGKIKQWEDLKSRLKIFAASFGDRIPETITRKEIVDWLFTFPGAAKSGRTVINLKQSICTFFNILRADGVIKHNPAAGIKRKELPRWVRKEIAFLSLDHSTRYLRACERYDPEFVAHEVIQLLAGVRADDEMANFNGDWVLPQTREIVIPEEIAKTEKREVISEMEPIFWEWWTAYGRGGILRPRSYHARWTRIRILATMEDQAAADAFATMSLHQVVKTAAATKAMRAWPWNARRRTFCTFHVAAKQSAEKTALILRHRGDTYTLHNSYRGTGVTQAQGIAYFDRKPAPVAAPIAPKAGTMPARGIVKQRADAKQKTVKPA